MNKAERAEKEALLLERAIDFNQIPAWQRIGVGLSWETYKKIGFDPIKKIEVKAKRRRVGVQENLLVGSAYEAWVKEILLSGEATLLKK